MELNHQAILDASTTDSVDSNLPAIQSSLELNDTNAATIATMVESTDEVHQTMNQQTHTDISNIASASDQLILHSSLDQNELTIQNNDDQDDDIREVEAILKKRLFRNKVSNRKFVDY